MARGLDVMSLRHHAAGALSPSASSSVINSCGVTLRSSGLANSTMKSIYVKDARVMYVVVGVVRRVD